MTTAKTQLPPVRPFTAAECAILVSAGIINDAEQAAVLEGTRLFDVDEYLEMVKAGVLLKEDRIELIDGKIIVMAPIGDSHVFGTDWLTMILAPLFAGLAIVRIGGPIYLNDRSAPQPDVTVVRIFHTVEEAHSRPDDVYFVIEVADSSLAYDTGAKLARYAAAGIPEVWVANLRIREVTAYADPSGSEYSSATTYRSGDSISPRAFPDVAVTIEDFMPPATHGNGAE